MERTCHNRCYTEKKQVQQWSSINAHAAGNLLDMADKTPDWQINFSDPWKHFAEQVIPC